MGKKLDRFQFPGRLVADGKVIPNNPRYTKGMLSLYDQCDVIVVIERRRRGKTRAQLGYYFGVVLPEIAARTGHSVEELDLIFKAKFLRSKVRWRGAEIFVSGSKAPLTSNELAEYVTEVIGEAGELGIEVPPADKLYQFKN